MKKSNSNENTIDFELLPDDPSLTDIDFGHEEVADTLVKIVSSAKPPFTIGLFSKWGTGKTIIAKLIEDKLRNSDIKVVYFDVWKYENDSLRRQFLLTAATELLGEKKAKELSKAFAYSIEKKEDIGIKFRSHELVRSLYLLTPFFVLTLVIVILIFNYFFKNADNWGLITLISGALSVLELHLLKPILIDLPHKVLVVDEITLTKDKLSLPDEFEKEFKKLISDKRLRNKKILFILDNLDRTAHHKASAFLTTIKTFLGENNCVFLIPCDEEAIKEHIEQVYLGNNKDSTKQNDYANEYLKKFFNLTLRIPKPYSLEFDHFVTKQIENSKFPLLQNNSQLVSVITSSYRNSPREIKQFINNLIAELLLVQSRIAKGNIEDLNFIADQNNIAFIAKLLVIKEKFPATYAKLKEKALYEATSWNSFVEDAKNDNGIINERGEKFLVDTESIVPYGSNLVLFITFKQSAEEKRLNGWDQFITFAQDRDVESAEKLFKSFVKEENLDIFLELAAEYVKQNRTAGEKTRYEPVSSCCIEIFYRDETVNVNNRLANELYHAIIKALDNLATYPNFRIKPTVDTIKNNINPNQNNLLAAKYVDILRAKEPDKEPTITKDNAVDIFQYISTNKDYFKLYLSEIRNLLNNAYYQTEYLEIFADNSDRREFILEDTLIKFIAGIKNTDIDDISLLENKIQIIKKFLEIFDKKSIETFIRKIDEIFSTESSNPMREQRKLLIVFAYEILKNFKGIVPTLDVVLQPQMENLTLTIGTFYKQAGVWNEKKDIYRLARLISLYPHNSRANELEASIFTNFASDADYATGYALFDEEERKEVVTKNSENVLSASIRSLEIYNLMKEHFDEAIKDIIIERLISSNHLDNAIIIAEDRNYKFNNNKQILTSFYDKKEQISGEHKLKLLEMSHKTKGADDPQLVERFYQHLLSLKESGIGADVIEKYTDKASSLFNESQIRVLTNQPEEITES